MPTPSLILVPARFKTGKLYTPLATTSGGTVLGASGDFNVTRATTATRVNASGLIESVASGVPRLDYYTSGGVAGCPALLVEPQAQNLAWHSQTWASGTNWNLFNTTTVTGTSGTLDPLGTNTANAISPTATSTGHEVFSNNTTTVSYTSGTIYTQSAFFKQGTGTAGRYVQLTFVGQKFSQNGYANFDLQLGTVTVVSGTSADTNRAASIENYGNGWYRCRLTATCNNAGTAIGVDAVLITASGSTRTPSFTGVATDIIYGWGAQLETGSVATSYIPTTTASVTRNADVISLSGAVSGCIGQTEGTIYAEVDYRAFASTSARRIISLLLDGSNVISLETSAASGSILLNVVSGVSNISATATGLTNGIYKIAAAYNNDASGTVIYVNGTLRDTKTSVVADVRGATIGLGIRSDLSAGTQFNDRIRSVALYPTKLTNAQLQALTT